MSSSVKRVKGSELTAEEVEAFLRQHPDFFIERDHLIAELRLPHASGSAISLVERQVSLFREQRDSYQGQLLELVDTARQNDRHFEKSRRLLLGLLEAQSLDETVIVLEDSFLSDFKVDYCTLVLFADNQQYPLNSVRIAAKEEAERLFSAKLESNRALCGQMTPEQLAFVFAADAESIGSSALMPLHYGETMGILGIASKSDSHFDKTMGSLFLSFIGDTLSRLVPPLLLKEPTRVLGPASPSPEEDAPDL